VSRRLNRTTAIGFFAVLLAVDATLTLIAIDSHTLRAGTSPALDVWDLAKAIGLAGLLGWKALRLGSPGLALTAVIALLVGVVSSTRIHAILAGHLPDLLGARGKLVIVSASVAVGVLALLLVRDPWPGFSQARRVILTLLLLLWVFAGLFDAFVPGGLGDLLEESGERLILSTSLALALSIQSSK
jgi:hypothetical protein